jgi:signal transduction histidine kinase
MTEGELKTPSGGHDGSPSVVWLVGGGSGRDEGVSAVRPSGLVASALIACVGLGALVFATDRILLTTTSVAPGVAIPMLYLGALVPCLWLPWRSALPVVAGGASVLTGLALVAIPGPVAAGEIVNRVLTVLVIWAGALVLGRLQTMRATLALTRAEAERACGSQSRFLTAAGHDLRHPIQAGLLFHDLLSRRLRGTPHAEMVANLGLSLTAMQRLLDGLLEMSRLESGRIEVHRGDLPVRVVLESLSARFAPVAATSGLVLRVVGCGAVIRSDPALLSRLLESLLSNAVKYTGSGRVLLGCRRRGDRLGIQVWDTGIGIPREHLREIFEAFVQLRQSAGDPGQGLGLPLAKRLAVVLDHPMGVCSTVGRGSMFEVLVPLVPPPGS